MRGTGELEGSGGEMPSGSAGASGVVSEALALIERAAGMVQGASAWALSDAESRAAVRGVYEVSTMVESAKLVLLADLDARAGAVAGARAPYVGRNFLTHGLQVNPGSAKRDVLAARALNRPDAGLPGDVPALPELARALAAGEVSRDHVDVAVRVWSKVPGHVAAATDDAGLSGMQKIDAFLTEQSQQFAPKDVDRLGRELLATVAADADTFDPDSVTRRFLSVSTDRTGMVVGRFQLDPVGGAAFKAMVDHLSRADQGPGVDESGQLVLVPDGRSLGQRRADALIAGARLAMAADPGTARQEPPHVLVIADLDQVRRAEAASGGRGPAGAVPQTFRRASGLAECTQTGPLRPGVLGQLLCDSIVQVAVLGEHGELLNLGRQQRTASRAQRRALAARDRGCVRAGCSAPPAACDAHHVTFWSHGGQTNVEDMVLLCQRDHTLVHAGLLEITMIDGVPYTRDLDGLNPNAPPLRNPWPHELARARELGQQLRLDLDDGP